jgi:hypothetical protein
MHLPTCLPVYPSKDVVSSDGVLAPEKFSRPAARALQGILKARELAVPARVVAGEVVAGEVVVLRVAAVVAAVAAVAAEEARAARSRCS